MSVPLIHENDVEELKLPGRDLRWLVNRDLLNAQHLSVCMVRIAPGKTVKPAHSHPNGEEVVYIIRGCGRVMVDGAVGEVKEGTTILFPQGSVHMLQNNGSEELKAICFYAPPSDLSTYKFFEDVEFPTS
jgi:quercetin dioxygenase-like cupin family protein